MTVYNSTAIIKSANQATHGQSRMQQSAFFTAPLTTALVANDTVVMGNLPPNARVIGATFSADQLDTGGAPTLALELGDAANATRYFPSSTIGRAATGNNANTVTAMQAAASNFLTSGTGVTAVIATCVTAAATWQAGNLYVRVDYYVDEPASVLNQ